MSIVKSVDNLLHSKNVKGIWSQIPHTHVSYVRTYTYITVNCILSQTMSLVNNSLGICNKLYT